MVLIKHFWFNIQLIFQDQIEKFCLNLHYNGTNSFLFVNATKIYQFKVKDSEIKNILCVYEIFQEMFHPRTWKTIGLNGCVYGFSADYRAFDSRNIIDVHKYLMKKQNIK